MQHVDNGDESVGEEMEGIDPVTERTDHGAAEELRTAVVAHARRARSIGNDGIQLSREWTNESLKFSEKVRLAYWNAFQHDCLNTAKATAYSAIFAIFPALGVAAALVTLLPGTAPLRFQLAVFFNSVLPRSVAPMMERYFTTAHSSPQGVRVLLGALVVSVVGAANVLGTLMEGFRRAYNLVDNCWGVGWRGSVRQQAQSFLLVPIALVPMSVTSLLVIFGHYMLTGLQYVLPMGWDTRVLLLAQVLRWAVSLLASATVLASIYRSAVPVTIPWRDVWPGAAFATVTWFLSTLVFGFYVTHFANYDKVYGSLGTGVVLLLWLFITALSVLCGAELNAELARDKVQLRPTQPLPETMPVSTPLSVE